MTKTDMDDKLLEVVSGAIKQENNRCYIFGRPNVGSPIFINITIKRIFTE